MFSHVLPDLLPDPEQDALTLVLAGSVLVRTPEVSCCYRTVDRGDDLPESDLGRGARQNVTAPYPALGADESCSFQREQDLLQVGLGKPGPVGDVSHRSRAELVGVQRQRQKSTARVVATRRNLHDQMLPGAPRPIVCPAPGRSRVRPSPGWIVAPPSICSVRHRVSGAVGTDSRIADPEPVLPAYRGACIASVTPALLGVVSKGPDAIPEWLPEPARHASQIVLLVLDGVGWAQLQAAKHETPTISSGVGGPITSVVPTTTATALTSISTGLTPAAHGIVGYRVAVRAEDASPGGAYEDPRARILNVLRWRTEDGDGRVTVPPRRFQPVSAFDGAPVPSVTRADFRATGFSAAHLDGARIIGWQVPSTIVVEVRRLLAEGATFVHAYYDGPDKVAHEHGLDEHYVAELRAADRLIGDLIEVLPRGACLLVTSDHGQVDVGRSAELPANDLLEASWLISGEGRFRWFHARPGAASDLEAAAVAHHGQSAWVRTVGQMQDEQWFGGPLTKEVASRLGDVALVARDPIAFLDPADPGETRLAARHGSLTPAEMYVPLLAFSAESERSE